MIETEWGPGGTQGGPDGTEGDHKWSKMDKRISFRTVRDKYHIAFFENTASEKYDRRSIFKHRKYRKNVLKLIEAVIDQSVSTTKLAEGPLHQSKPLKYVKILFVPLNSHVTKVGSAPCDEMVL